MSVPENYVAELAKVNQAPPIVRNWSVAKTLEDMDKAGVATSILSPTTPQVSFTNAANARRIARESNEWVARLSQDHPGRFGSFAMIPMQDTDTTRTIVDIVFSGTAARCPDLQFIFSHAGGTLPFLTERLVRAPIIDSKLSPRVPRGVLTELKRFYYDTAWAMHPMALASLTRLVDVSQILFGSDYPYRTGEDTIKGLIEYGFSDAELKAIGRGNALRLLPRRAA